MMIIIIITATATVIQEAFFLLLSLPLETSRCPKGDWWEDKFRIVNDLAFHYLEKYHDDPMNERATRTVKRYIVETETLLMTNR